MPEKLWPVGVGGTARDLLMEMQARLASRGTHLSFRALVEMAIISKHAEVMALSIPEVEEEASSIDSDLLEQLLGDPDYTDI